nr:MAG TPA: hypothetical protein [Bacteriophage sp.]
MFQNNRSFLIKKRINSYIQNLCNGIKIFRTRARFVPFADCSIAKPCFFLDSHNVCALFVTKLLNFVIKQIACLLSIDIENILLT